MKYARIQFALDVQDPALSVGGLFNGRRDYTTPAYTITREGDVVRLEHLAGIIEVPWTHVAWAVPAPTSAPDESPVPAFEGGANTAAERGTRKKAPK